MNIVLCTIGGILLLIDYVCTIRLNTARALFFPVDNVSQKHGAPVQTSTYLLFWLFIYYSRSKLYSNHDLTTHGAWCVICKFLTQNILNINYYIIVIYWYNNGISTTLYYILYNNVIKILYCQNDVMKTRFGNYSQGDTSSPTCLCRL